MKLLSRNSACRNLVRTRLGGDFSSKTPLAVFQCGAHSLHNFAAFSRVAKECFSSMKEFGSNPNLPGPPKALAGGKTDCKCCPSSIGTPVCANPLAAG